MIDGYNNFALDVYQSLSVEKEENLIFSPFSISLALAMAFAGARGTTREQMERVLHLDLPIKEFSVNLKEVCSSLGGIDESIGIGNAQVFKLNLANSIWGQEGYAYKPDFLKLLLDYYSTGVKLLNFIHAPEKARQEINRWISKETEKRIQNLIPPGGISDMTRLVLANAIYFYASWENPFKKNSTRDNYFYLLNGESVKVPMMTMVKHVDYYKGPGFQVVSLPYVGGRFSMYIILPPLKRFEIFERKLDAKLIRSICSSVRRRKVDVTFPKFNYDGSFSLRRALVSLGMELAFCDQADFSGMEPTRELFIHNVYHKAFIAVDEKGTEAAAASAGTPTAVAYRFGFREKVYKFTADHPFIFFVYDPVTGSILFMGRVLNPN
jgi:serpin B